MGLPFFVLLRGGCFPCSRQITQEGRYPLQHRRPIGAPLQACQPLLKLVALDQVPVSRQVAPLVMFRDPLQPAGRGRPALR